MGFVDGTSCATSPTARDAHARAAPPRRRVDRRRAGRIHAVDVDAVGLGDLGRQRGLHRAPAQALVRPVRASRRPASCPLVDEVHDRLLATHPRAGPGHDRPRRLPARQLHGRRRRRRSPPCSTGRSARSATRSPTSGCCMVYWTDPDEPTLPVCRRPTVARRASRRRPSCSSATPSASGRDLSRHRLLRGLRVLEAGLHPRGRVRPLRRRRHGRPGRRRRLRLLRRAGRARWPRPLADASRPIG